MTPDSLPVPPIAFETHFWTVERSGRHPRSAIALATGEYQSALPQRIADLEISFPSVLAADVAEATGALARFDQHAAARLGIGSQALGPLSSVLLRTESTSSSQIENLTVGARQLARAEIGQSTSTNADAVVANVAAMEAALSLADKLDLDAVLSVHRALLSGQRGWEHHAGTLRDQLVWVGTSSISPRGAQHVAPQPEHVPELIKDLLLFTKRDDIPALAQAALAHAQFQTIHPFADGNGRTGRALMQAMLRNKALVVNATVPLSAGLLTDTEGYFSAIRSYQSGDGRPIVERFVEASLFAASSGSELVDALAEVVSELEGRIADVRADSTAWRVIPLLVSNPALTTQFLAVKLGVTDAVALRALAVLTERGVLVERSGKQRNRVWEQPDILSVLDAYAASLIRR